MTRLNYQRLKFFVLASVSLVFTFPLTSYTANVSKAMNLEDTKIAKERQNSLIMQADTSKPRLCPGCVDGGCSATTVVSGLPIVQLIVAAAVGFGCAAMFIWLYASFYEEASPGGYYRSTKSWSWPPNSSSGIKVRVDRGGRATSGYDHTESGRSLLYATNIVLDAIQVFGDKFL